MHDSQSCIPLTTQLKDGNLILLLTPGVAPEPSSAPLNPDNPPSDPFEPLGKALARHHPWVRHVPYMPRNGITNTHVVHIRLAAVVIFVISGPPRHRQPSQIALAEITKALCEQRPHIVLTCCDVTGLGSLNKSFPTIVETPTLTPFDLESAADSLFAELRRPSLKSPILQSPEPLKLENLAVRPVSFTLGSGRDIGDKTRSYSLTTDGWKDDGDGRILSGLVDVQSVTKVVLQPAIGYPVHFLLRHDGRGFLTGTRTYERYGDNGDDGDDGLAISLDLEKMEVMIREPWIENGFVAFVGPAE